MKLEGHLLGLQHHLQTTILHTGFGGDALGLKKAVHEDGDRLWISLRGPVPKSYSVS